jgi:ABC-type Co2+ transport system permease subunit
MLSLWAVHIQDGFLTAPAIWCGWGLALALAMVGAWRLADEEIPRLALLTAAFFIASSIHVPIPGSPTSAHLLLNGLVGVVLGWRAALAIPIGLFLQAALLGHGGFFALGVNSCVVVLPALLARCIFVLIERLPWKDRVWFRSVLVAVGVLALAWGLTFGIAFLASYHVYRDTDLGNAAHLATAFALQLTFDPMTLAGTALVVAAVTWWQGRSPYSGEAALGFLIGVLSVLATIALNCLALLQGGVADFTQAALISFLAHLPIAVIEGIVLAFTVSFLARVKPELLGRTTARSTPAPVAIRRDGTD